eukprot:TRINITY_DN27889_c5_g1_i1.p1 TRINITY_DN27889_c5_g1~~TRINITY_DN27889_c5_g1_i1.p1  ORF type:complete len:530 (+),score=113.65 TRINITY_DN27889_c5_g1_i1:46-1590(+)
MEQREGSPEPHLRAASPSSSQKDEFKVAENVGNGKGPLDTEAWDSASAENPQCGEGPQRVDWTSPDTEAGGSSPWLQGTMQRLKNARALRQVAEGQLLKTSRDTRRNTEGRESATKRFQNTVKLRISNMELFVRAFMEHVQLLEKSIHKVGYTSFSLQRADSNAATQLDVVQRRLELREQRPPRACIKDPVAKALEEELKVLSSMRSRMASSIDACRAMQTTMEELREALLVDVRNKRHAMRLDRVVYRGPDVNNKQGETADAKNKRMTMLSPTAPTQTLNWQEEAQNLLLKVRQTDMSGGRMIAEHESFMAEAIENAERTQKQSNDRIKSNIAELTEYRRALDGEVQEFDALMNNMEVTLAETKRQCDLCKVPLQQLEASNALRKTRIGGENIRDSVKMTQMETFMMLNQTQQVLQDRYFEQSETLKQMSVQREELWQDLQEKVASLNVELAVSRTTSRPKSGGSFMKPQPPQQIRKDHFRRRHLERGWTQTSAREGWTEGEQSPNKGTSQQF